MSTSVTPFVRGLVVFALLFASQVVQVVPAEAKPARKGGGHDMGGMALHHMHTMMDHGLVMVLQGSDLVMLAEMKMAPGVDEVTATHGKKMMADGKAMIQDVLGGEQMALMHKKGQGTGAAMKYTHQLGNALLSVVADLDAMKMDDPDAPGSMKMHHMHIALNHALEMAAEGANLVMLGEMGMAKGVDRHSVDHGRQMIADAQQLWQEIMSGSAMSEMHAAGITGQSSPHMKETHRLADDGKKVLDLLAAMPSAK